MKTQRIYPSVMAQSQKEMDALFTKLDGVTKELHLDVADGKAVPGKANYFTLKLDSHFTYNAHLMIKNPRAWIKKYGDKVDYVIPMVEEIKDIQKYISWMKKQDYKVAFSLNPKTKYATIKPYIDEIDIVLILTVNPGFYGAKYLKSPLKKITQIKHDHPKIKVMVDGGMTPKTIGDADNAGADYFVSGSFVSKSDSPKAAILELKRAIK